MALSVSARSELSTPRQQLDEATAALNQHATEFARLGAGEKAALLRECLPRLVDAADGWVAAGCRAKGLSPQYAGEEWIAGPWISTRIARLLCESLEAIQVHGHPFLGRGAYHGSDGRYRIKVFPENAFGKVLYTGFSGTVLMEPGVDQDEAVRRQAAFYQRHDPEGRVALILGAGNVTSIPAGDTLSKMFVDGCVVLLKMNPVNEWAGPFLEHAFAPLVRRGFLRIVYGGVEEGEYLVRHKAVDTIHITGSNLSHDNIVWGPPGTERDRRMALSEPLCDKPITSELGNVSPVAIVPYTYSDAELLFQAEHVATMVTNNASFNCNAAKMLITSSRWPQRERFLDMLGEKLARTPTRKAYYPGTIDRYNAIIGKRDAVQKFGQEGKEKLAWTLVRGIDTKDPDEPLCREEAFCGILGETSLASADPVEFLFMAVDLMNNRLWGTLNACIIIHPRLEADATVGKALDTAILDLRYGTVGINLWPAVGFGTGTMPWGGYPTSSLTDIQSGSGWVHNTYMLDGIDKAVLRGPITIKPKPVWFSDNTKCAAVGPRLVRMDAKPGWGQIPGILFKVVM